MTDQVPEFVHTDLAKLGIEIPPEMLDKLTAYLDALLDENTRINLTGIKDRDLAWRRHIIDSLTLLPFMTDLKEDETVLDVGSGGGLPGVPLAITRPDLIVTLLESTGKKARFLERFPVRVLNDRAETLGQDWDHREKYHAVTCRALGPMRELLEYTLPFLRRDGVLFAMKGPSVKDELKDAGDALETLGAGVIEVFDAYPTGPDGFDTETVIVRVVKERQTPGEFPRLPGIPRQAPL